MIGDWRFQNIVAFIFFAALISGCSAKNESTVVVYTSQDQVYAEPIFKKFEQERKIKVLPVYDSEAAKTVGLINRLIAEKNHPQCDVFWNSEELRTRQLRAQNLFEKGEWVRFGYRSRRLAIDTNRLNVANAPKTWIELTNANWRGKVVLSYPLFGTTATHFLALRQHWGADGWRNWCRALAANKPMLVDGNSVAAKMVATGEALVAMTDSDDIAAENREGAHLLALPMTGETLLIPNTVCLLRGGPHSENAQKLFHFFQQHEVVESLVAARALEGISADEIKTPTLQPDWEKLLSEPEAAAKELKEIFLR